MDNLLVTKATLKEDFEGRMKSGGIFIKDPVGLTPPVLGGKLGNLKGDALYAAAMGAPAFGGYQPGFRYSGKHGTPYDLPMKWSDGKERTVREAIRDGVLSLKRDAKGSTNTLMPDWTNLWNAVRLDISIQKAAIPTVRQYFYNELSKPEATRSVLVSEIYPPGVVFEKNNGEGQAIPQGETRAGGYASVIVDIFAAGFTWTLLAELFDQSMDLGRIGDAVAIGYNSKKDDLAIDPIINYASYGDAGKTTVAAVLAGAQRQELLYLTFENAIDELGVRVDPVTQRPIDASGLVVLACEYDAAHISRVIQGLPSFAERYYPALGEISRVIGYNGEYIPLRDRTVKYVGPTKGTAYLIKPNRYMNILVKRGLTVEVDPLPEIKTLAREERAYWFAEGIHYEGIASFVQKVTLPAW